MSFEEMTPESVRAALAAREAEPEPGTRWVEDEPLPDGSPAERAAAAVARARTTDPGTSHAAAKSLDEPTLRRSQAAVLEVLRAGGPACDETLQGRYAVYSRRDPVAFPYQSQSGLRTRRKELEDAGLVRDTGNRQRLTSERLSIIWEAVPRETQGVEGGDEDEAA